LSNFFQVHLKFTLFLLESILLRKFFYKTSQYGLNFYSGFKSDPQLCVDFASTMLLYNLKLPPHYHSQMLHCQNIPPIHALLQELLQSLSQPVTNILQLKK